MHRLVFRMFGESQRRRNFLVAALWGLVLFALATAANAEHLPEWRSYTSVDGLKNSWVFYCTASPRGTIWMSHGDVDELTAYDGRSFWTVQSPEHRNRVYEAPSGLLWSIGQAKPETVTGPANPEGPRSVKIYQDAEWAEVAQLKGTAFCPLLEDTLLFIQGGRLHEFTADNRETRTLLQPEQTSIGPFTGMIRSHDGGVWIVADGGAAKLQSSKSGDSAAPLWTEHPISEDLKVRGLLKPLEGTGGRLVAVALVPESGNRVLVEFDGHSWQIVYRPPKQEYLIAGWRGLDDRLWVVRGKEPLAGYVTEWDLFHIGADGEIEVPEMRVLTGVLSEIVVEEDGAFWLATSNGLARYAPSIWRHPNGGPGSDVNILDIHEDPSGRLYSSSEGRLDIRDEQGWTTHVHPLLWSLNTCSLGNGLVVYGMESGTLAVFDPDGREFDGISLPGDELVKYYEDAKDGHAWMLIEAPNGMCRLVLYDGETIQTVLESWDIQKAGGNYYSLRDILQTENGEIWFGSLTALATYKDGRLRSIGTEDGYEPGSSLCLLERADGTIWVAGCNGIQAYDGSKWTRIEAPGFDTVRSMIHTQDGSVLVGSGSGVHRFCEDSWSSYSMHEGLPEAAVKKLLEDSHGRIWAATSGGVSRYHPEADLDPPETFIPSKKNPNEIPPDGEVHLLFEGLDKWKYTPEERLMYSYRLDDQQWSPFEEHAEFSATGLSAGSHSFEVRAMDRDWNIDPTPATHTFQVLLPWYKEPAFIWQAVLSGLLIAISMGYALSRHFRLEKLVVVRTAELTTTNKSLEREVAERTQAEERLLDSERDLRATFEQAAVGIAWVGMDGTWLRVNQKICDIVGYTRAELLELTFQDITHPEDLDEDLDYVRQVLAGEIATYSMEKRHIRKDRSPVWINLTVSLVRESDGSPKHFVSVVEDISERKLTEARETALLREYEALFQSPFIMVAKIDADGNYTLANKTTVRTLGYSTNELLAMDSLTLVHPDDIFEVSNRLKEVLAGKASTAEYRIRKKDDSYLDVSTTTVLLPCTPETKRHVICISRDITDRKRAAAEMKEHRTHLEERVQDRTTELREMVNLMAGREVRMAELKEVIEKLRTQLEKAGMTPVADDPLRSQATIEPRNGGIEAEDEMSL